MIAVAFIICLLGLVALLLLLRYEGFAKRSKEHGELQEPFLNGIKRGIATDLRTFMQWAWRH